MSADAAVHLHELRCSQCRLELGSIHRRDDAGQEVVGFFYSPSGEAVDEGALIGFLQSVQRGPVPPCPRCGSEVHEGCLVQDIQVLNPRRHRKRGRRRAS